MTVLVLLSGKAEVKDFCPVNERVLKAPNETVLNKKLFEISDAHKSLVLVICLENKNKENNPIFDRMHHDTAVRQIKIFFRGKNVDYDLMECIEYSYDKCA